MNIDEKKIVDILQGHGLRAEEFTKEQKRLSKTTDFQVFREDKLVFFCEVKTIRKDEWLEITLKKEFSAFRVIPDPAFNSISNKIHEAIRQFNLVNPDLKYPNVLAFINYERSCRWENGRLLNVITGLFFADDGTRHPIYIRFSEGRIKKEKTLIHLYLWLDVFMNSDPGFLFTQINKKHFKNLCNYFGKKPDSLKNIFEKR